MKKIFAIALAVVMVLSMASAFAASDCFVWGKDWSCSVADNTPWCGKGAVEVLPLVKVNTACGWEFQVNTCAGAVRSEEVYYAVKLTVDEYPDADWWNEAALVVEFWDDTEMALPFAFAEDDVAGSINLKAKEEIEYYWFPHVGWVDMTNTDKAYKAVVNGAAQVDDSVIDLKDAAMAKDVVSTALACGESFDDYEICATLSSFYDGGSVRAYNKLGDYEYTFKGFTGTVGFADMDEVEEAVPSEFDGELVVVAKNDDGDIVNKVVFNVVEGAIVTPNWNFPEYKDNDKFYLKVMEDFGFDACGTAACVTFANIQANFGWNDSFESCTDWSDKAVSIVDTECVVAIPKTGDASVLAWLF